MKPGADPTLRQIHAPAQPGTSGTAEPKRFGKYVLKRELGRGGMGVVWLARDPTLERDVALKTLTVVDVNSTDGERLRREALAVARLRHPNIIQVFEVGIDAGRQYFTMEYVQGLSLEALAPEMDLRRKVEVVRDLARALHFAHEHDVVHRDVKPTNVLIDSKSGRVVLMDFGLARTKTDLTSLTLAGSLMGTPKYMAPEQAFGDRNDVTAQTDVFSLGSVFYFLLCGRSPFEHEDVIRTINAVLTLDPPEPHRVNRAVPRELGLVCLKALEKEPRDRYATAAEVAAELERWLGGETVLARPRTALERAKRWVRRNRLVAGLGVALAAAISVAAWAMSRDPSAALVPPDPAPVAPPTADPVRERRERARGFLDAGARHLEIAERAMMTGRGDSLRSALEEAVAQFTRALGVAPGDAIALTGRGRAQRLAGDRDAATADLDHAIAADPEWGAAWYERGLVRLSRFHEALDAVREGGAAARAAADELRVAAGADLRRAAEAPPEVGRAWLPIHARAALAFLAGDFGRARADLDLVLDQHPFLDDALVLRAMLRFAATPPDLHGALLDLDRAVQANALSAIARNVRGVARTRADDLQGAREDHEAAVKLDPEYAPALLNRGRIRIRLGDTAGGLTDLRSFLERFASHPRAAEVRAELLARSPK